MNIANPTQLTDIELFSDGFDGNSALDSSLNKIASSKERVEALGQRFIKYYDQYPYRKQTRWAISNDQCKFIETLENMQLECQAYLESKGEASQIQLVTHVLNHTFSTTPDHTNSNVTAEVYFLSPTAGLTLWDRFSMTVDSPVMCYFLTIYTYNAQRLYRVAPHPINHTPKTKLYRFHPERFKAVRSHLNPVNTLYTKSVPKSTGLLTLDQLNTVVGHIVTGANAKKLSSPLAKSLDSPHPSFVIDAEMALTTAYARFNAAGRQIFELPETLVSMLYKTENDDIELGSIKLPYNAQYLYFGPQKDLVLDDGWLVDGAYVEARGESGSGCFRFTLTAIHEDSDKKWFLDPEAYFSQDLIGSDFATKNLKTAVQELYNETINSLEQSVDRSGQIEEAQRETNLQITDVSDENNAVRLQQQAQRFPEYKVALRLIVNALCFITAYPDAIDEEWSSETPVQYLDNAHSVKDKRKHEIKLLKDGYVRVKLCGRKISEKTKNLIGKTKDVHWRKGHWRNQQYGVQNLLRKIIWIMPMLIGANSDDDLPENGRIYEVNDQ